jgi:hypothetical protein
MRPKSEDHPVFAGTYIEKVSENDLVGTLSESVRQLEHHLACIPETKAEHSYGPGKWNVRQVLRHVIDTERIFAYRALCVARGEQAPLPSFDEGAYAREADHSLADLNQLREEFMLVRKSTDLMFRSFPADILERSGHAANSRVTVNALGYMIIGHWRHHLDLLTERYGISFD